MHRVTRHTLLLAITVVVFIAAAGFVTLTGGRHRSRAAHPTTSFNEASISSRSWGATIATLRGKWALRVRSRT
jgi:hypothetical protein